MREAYRAERAAQEAERNALVGKNNGAATPARTANLVRVMPAA
jgi:hypothetical protein